MSLGPVVLGIFAIGLLIAASVTFVQSYF